MFFIPSEIKKRPIFGLQRYGKFCIYSKLISSIAYMRGLGWHPVWQMKVEELIMASNAIGTNDAFTLMKTFQILFFDCVYDDQTIVLQNNEFGIK